MWRRTLVFFAAICLAGCATGGDAEYNPGNILTVNVQHDMMLGGWARASREANDRAYAVCGPVQAVPVILREERTGSSLGFTPQRVSLTFTCRAGPPSVASQQEAPAPQATLAEAPNSATTGALAPAPDTSTPPAANPAPLPPPALSPDSTPRQVPSPAAPPAVANEEFLIRMLPDTSEQRRITETIYQGRTQIYVSGEISEDSAQLLRFFVLRHAIRRATVHLDSPGGSLMGGIELGRTIRNLGFDTSVGSGSALVRHGLCASACAYAFAGGIHRYYSGESAQIGVHRFSARGGAMNSDASQLASGLIVSYLEQMGVSSELFSLATFASSEEIIWLSEGDAERLRLSTGGDPPRETTTRQTSRATSRR